MQFAVINTGIRSDFQLLKKLFLLWKHFKHALNFFSKALQSIYIHTTWWHKSATYKVHNWQNSICVLQILLKNTLFWLLLKQQRHTCHLVGFSSRLFKSFYTTLSQVTYKVQLNVMHNDILDILSVRSHYIYVKLCFLLLWFISVIPK